MLQNTNTEDETQALRETECAEIHIHADTKEKVTIKWLESRFQQQQEEITRVNVLPVAGLLYCVRSDLCSAFPGTPVGMNVSSSQ